MRRPPSSGPTTNVKLGARLEHSHSVADVGHLNDRLRTQLKSAAPGAEQRPLRPDSKLKQRCDWCGKSFIPRHRSGGSKQKFRYYSRVSSEPPTGKRQRTHREAALRCATNHTHHLTARRELKRRPCEPAVAALHPWQTGTLAIADCTSTDFDSSSAARTKTKPLARGWKLSPQPEVQALMDRHSLSHWVERNNETRTVRAMTVAAPKYRD